MGEHPGGDRHGPVPRLVGGAADHPGQLRDLGPQLGGGRRPLRQAGEGRVAGGVEPRLPVGGDAAGGDGLGDPLALRGRHPCRGAAPRRWQQLTREDEQRPPHRELLHHRPGVVQLGVDVLGLDLLGAGGDREVHGGRLGRVQDRHRAGHRGDVGQPVRRRQRVAYGDPAAALGVADPSPCHRRLPVAQSRCDLPGRSSIRWSATSASASVSGSTVIRLTTVPATRLSRAQTRCGRSMRFIVEQ